MVVGRYTLATYYERGSIDEGSDEDGKNVQNLNKPKNRLRTGV